MAETVNGITFNTVHHAVDDLGMDPTGNTDISTILSNNVASSTLIKFPPGDYLLASSGPLLDGLSDIGFRGIGGHRRDVRIFPQTGEGPYFNDASPTGCAGPILYKDLCFDETADLTTGIWVSMACEAGVQLENVEWLGKTGDDSFSNHHIYASVGLSSGSAMVEELHFGLEYPANTESYPAGIATLRLDGLHEGQFTYKNCRFHWRNSSVTRFEQGGRVMLEGCEFINCQNASIRGNGGDHSAGNSYAEDCYGLHTGDVTNGMSTIIQNENTSPNTMEYRNVHLSATGAVCTRAMAAGPDFGDDAPCTATYTDCVFQNDTNDNPTVGYDAEASACASDDVVLDNCDFTGTSAGTSYATNRSVAEIKNSRIEDSQTYTDFTQTNNTTSGAATPENVSAFGEIEGVLLARDGAIHAQDGAVTEIARAEY